LDVGNSALYLLSDMVGGVTGGNSLCRCWIQ